MMLPPPPLPGSLFASCAAVASACCPSWLPCTHLAGERALLINPLAARLIAAAVAISKLRNLPTPMWRGNAGAGFAASLMNGYANQQTTSRSIDTGDTRPPPPYAINWKGAGGQRQVKVQSSSASSQVLVAWMAALLQQPARSRTEAAQ